MNEMEKGDAIVVTKKIRRPYIETIPQEEDGVSHSIIKHIELMPGAVYPIDEFFNVGEIGVDTGVIRVILAYGEYIHIENLPVELGREVIKRAKDGYYEHKE